jgi:aspartate carbamoyltransferase catalytic subunit
MPVAITDIVLQRGHRVTQFETLPGSLKDADVLYATRLQRERFTEELGDGFHQSYQIDLATVNALCSADTIIMHPLPRDGRDNARDLSDDLNHDARLAIFRQTDNGIPVRMALFAMMLGVDHLIEASMRHARWRKPLFIGPDDAAFAGLADFTQ